MQVITEKQRLSAFDAKVLEHARLVTQAAESAFEMCDVHGRELATNGTNYTNGNDQKRSRSYKRS